VLAANPERLVWFRPIDRVMFYHRATSDALGPALSAAPLLFIAGGAVAQGVRSMGGGHQLEPCFHRALPQHHGRRAGQYALTDGAECS